MKIKKLNTDDILTFGKNKGYTLAEVYKYQPSYLEWAIINIVDFKINIDEFEKLPNPTPFNYSKLQFSDELTKEKRENLTISQTLKLLDVSNHLITIHDIKKLVEDGRYSLKEIIYKFPEKIKKLNEKK